MFSPKIAMLYRMSNRFAKWAGAFCKLLPDSDADIHHRLLGLSQSIPCSIAAAGSNAAGSDTQKQYLKQALEYTCDFGSLLSSLTVGIPTESDLIHEGNLIVNTLISLLVEELSSLVVTDVHTTAKKTIVMQQ